MTIAEANATASTAASAAPAPAVDVIIGTACREERAGTMERALASLRAQAEVRVRPLIIVNGSSYHPPLLERLRADPWLQVHYVESGGFPAALAVGRSKVRGEFFAFLDDDDELLPDTLALRVAPMLRDPAIDVVAANGIRRVAEREATAIKRLPRDVPEATAQFLDDSWLASCGGLYRSATVGTDFFDGLTMYFEWTLIALRLLLAHKKLEFLDLPVFRKHEGGDSLSYSPAYKEAHATFVEGLQVLPLPDTLRRKVESKLATSFNSRSLFHLNRGEVGAAWRWHLKTLSAPRGWRYLTYTRRLSVDTLAAVLRRQGGAPRSATDKSVAPPR